MAMEIIALIVAVWLVTLVASVVLGHVLAGRSPSGPRRLRR